jgi:hypothetical protein
LHWGIARVKVNWRVKSMVKGISTGIRTGWDSPRRWVTAMGWEMTMGWSRVTAKCLGLRMAMG